MLMVSKHILFHCILLLSNLSRIFSNRHNIEQEDDFLVDYEQEDRGIDDIITDIGRLYGSTEDYLDLVKEFCDCVSTHPHVIGDSRVALAIAILYKSFDSDVREIASPLLSKVPPLVLQEDSLVAKVHSTLPRIESGECIVFNARV